MAKQIPLHMKTEPPEATTMPGAEGGETVAPVVPTDSADQPVIGWLAVGCGLLGVFSWGLIFVPMALAFSVAALLAGQVVWGFAGLVLAVIGFFSSPTLWTLAGLGAIAAFFGIPGL